MTQLHDPLRRVVGGATAVVLAESLDLHTVGDLLRHYPRRYIKRGELTDLGSLRVGEHATVLAQIRSTRVVKNRYRKGLRVETVVTDGRGELVLTFFNQRWREDQLVPGQVGLFAGKVDVFNRRRQLTHPVYEMLPSDEGGVDDEAAQAAASAFAEELIPVYPASSAIPSMRIAKAVKIVLDTLAEDLPDPVPSTVRDRHRLMALREALLTIHRPHDHADAARARNRLAWEEAFVLQVELARRRAQARVLPAVSRQARSDGIRGAFDGRMPFTLTKGQRDVSADIERDLADTHPMHRLLQGEVGSGKTVVALRAMLTVVDAGGQAALLAPTEVLAQQHHRSIAEMLGPLGLADQLGSADQATKLVLLTGSQPAATRRAALLDAASGAAGLVVGTHALLEENVQFADLGLVVVDEQHRFGVEQRARLTDKADKPPHLLVMTATPIPRTVAMTVFGDLDISTLTELPVGRAPISSHVVPVTDRPGFVERTWERLREEVAAGHQAYIVCPRIGDGADGEEGDAVDAPRDLDELADGSQPAERPPLAVVDVADGLMRGTSAPWGRGTTPDRDGGGPLGGLRLEILHGRLPPDAKDDAMRRFAAGDIDVLVSTTVIEVGVDVPNATVMVVMDAERFGVAQLHQLRGRVGRGTAPGLCLFVTELPEGRPGRERLEAVAATSDGFELARLDLEQRREGDVLGAAQSGRRSSLRMLGVLRDEGIIKSARAEAIALIEADPELAAHPALDRAVADLLDPERAEFLEKS